MGRPVAELLGGRPSVRASVTGPDRQTTIEALIALVALCILLPVKLVPVAVFAAACYLLSHVRLYAMGGGSPPISSRELTEWMAYYQLEPWGTEPADWRAGLLASTIANVHRDPKQRRKPYEPEDFIPQREPARPQEQSVEEQLAVLERWKAVAAAAKAARQRQQQQE